MNMIQKILTPIDIENDSSEHVVRYAIELSKIFGAKLIYFNRYTLPSQPAAGANVMAGNINAQLNQKEIKEIKEDQFKGFLERLPEASSVFYEFVPLPVTTIDLIYGQTKELDVDIVVLGTEESLGIEKFIGTMAERITRKSPCPVIVLPKDRPYHPLKKVCLAIDPDHSIDEQNLSVLLMMAKGFNIPLSIVHVQRDKEEVKKMQVDLFEQLKNQIEKYELKYSISTISSEDVERGIVEFTELNKIDLLALVYREHGFFSRMFNPGLRKKMVSHSDLPLLILK